jgi:outer membrane receptor protein involved in Fe transport
MRNSLIRNFIFAGSAILASSITALPQAAGYGSLVGTVKDSLGLALPGVTVSISGPAMVGERTATTDVNGSFRFPALAAGAYKAVCEMLGFQTLNRDGVVIASGQTLSMDLTLEPAPIPEVIPEAPGPPVFEANTTRAGAVFDTGELENVPNATDMWAVLDASPGIRMRGYDVGGSHKGQQTEYETYGIRGQNRILNEGVNTTEGTSGAGGYYDYYAVQEFQVGALGLDVEMSTPGAQVIAAWKSGSNRFTGLDHGDFETEDFVADNLDDELTARGGTSALMREFYEYHLDLGGPIVKDRAWFYAAHNRFFLDRAVSGQDPEIATDIADFDTFTGKINVHLTERDKLIGFSHWSFKQKPNRGLSSIVPAESVLAQESWSWFHKAEWQRAWSERLSTSLLVGHFGYNWQMVPRADPLTQPPRLDTATGVQTGAGWQPFTSDRWKPQSTGQIDYYLDTARAGKHDVKLGWDWQLDRNGNAWSDASGAIRYLDNSQFGRPSAVPEVFVDRILFANVPNQGETDHNQHTDIFAQDIWSLSDRLSLTLGVRFGRQDLYHADIASNPLQSDIFEAGSFPGSAIKDWWNVAPRLGATFDPTGKGKTIFKAYFGRFYANVGSGLEEANPGGRSTRIYDFLDLNGNGFYDGTHELGDLLETTGGNLTDIDPNLELAYSDELSFSVEQELATDVGFRFSFIHKRYRNWWDSGVNVAQVFNLTNPVTATCSGCPLGLEEASINLVTIPDDSTTLVDNRIANVPLLPTTGGEDTEMRFTTWELALNRRFRDNFFLSVSFDKEFRDELRSPDSATGPFTEPMDQRQAWFQNHSVDIANRQETKAWSFKFLTRYVAPLEIGLALGVRLQSGYPWAPVHTLLVPNVGTKDIHLMDFDENRSEDVTIVDFRVDKAWLVSDRYRITAMADVYNLLNDNPETDFIVRTGNRFQNVIDWLPGRTLSLGLRFEF